MIEVCVCVDSSEVILCNVLSFSLTLVDSLGCTHTSCKDYLLHTATYMLITLSQVVGD